MDRETLTKLLEHSVARLKNNELVEEAKLELKRQWPCLNSPDPKERQIAESELLKDIVGLVNKPGPEGYLVFGIDEKTGDLFDAPFSQCGLRDAVDLARLIVKRVDLPVRVEVIDLPLLQKTVSVLILPPSIEKPHFITRYVKPGDSVIDNYIPIRKTNGIFPATRSDVEMMYYDRKNIEPEYALTIFAHNPRLFVNVSPGKTQVDFQLAFENFGRKPVVIVDSTMTISADPPAHIPNDTILTLEHHSEHSIQERSSYLSARYLTVPSNRVATLMVSYVTSLQDERMRMIRDYRPLSFIIEATDLHNNQYQSQVLTSTLR